MNNSDIGAPKLPYSKAEIYAAVKKRAEEVLLRLNAKKREKNAVLVQKLENLTEEDLHILPLEAELQIGHLEINCTAEGSRRFTDGRYMTRTFNDVVQSSPHVFLLSGNENLAILAEKHYGYSSYQYEAFTLSGGGLSAENVAKKVANNYCSQQFSNVNMTMNSCRVNNYSFEPTSEKFRYYGWAVYIETIDPKGEPVHFSVAYIEPKSISQTDFQLTSSFSVSTPKSDKTRETESRKRRTAWNVVHSILFGASLIFFVVGLALRDGGLSMAALMSGAPVLIPSVLLFICSKVIPKRGAKIFFSVLSMIAIACAFGVGALYLFG